MSRRTIHTPVKCALEGVAPRRRDARAQLCVRAILAAAHSTHQLSLRRRVVRLLDDALAAALPLDDAPV